MDKNQKDDRGQGSNTRADRATDGPKRDLKDLSNPNKENHDPKTKVQDIGEPDKKMENREMEEEEQKKSSVLVTSDVPGNSTEHPAEENMGVAQDNTPPSEGSKTNPV